MSNKDFRRREVKKQKKDSKKAAKIINLEPQVTVEVIKKGKKIREDEE